MKTQRQKEIDKAFRAYERAEYNLIKIRSEEFPPGTKVKCRVFDGMATVVGGSLYPDQVNTNLGHMGWRTLEKINAD